MRLEEASARHRRVARLRLDRLDAEAVPGEHRRHVVDDPGVVVADQVDGQGVLGLRGFGSLGLRARMGRHLEEALELAQ